MLLIDKLYESGKGPLAVCARWGKLTYFKETGFDR